MKSATPKVLHEVGGRTLVGHAVAAAAALDPEHLTVVVGHGREQVTAHLAEIAPQASTAAQDKRLGTRHAVRSSPDVPPQLDGVVVVTYADVPLLTADTLRDLVDVHARDGNAVTVLTAMLDDPKQYGRIVRDADNGVLGIVEYNDATDDIKELK